MCLATKSSSLTTYIVVSIISGCHFWSKVLIFSCRVFIACTREKHVDLAALDDWKTSLDWWWWAGFIHHPNISLFCRISFKYDGYHPKYHLDDGLFFFHREPIFYSTRSTPKTCNFMQQNLEKVEDFIHKRWPTCYVAKALAVGNVHPPRQMAHGIAAALKDGNASSLLVVHEAGKMVGSRMAWWNWCGSWRITS